MKQRGEAISNGPKQAKLSDYGGSPPPSNDSGWVAESARTKPTFGTSKPLSPNNSANQDLINASEPIGSASEPKKRQTKVQVYRLLLEDWHAARIARHLKKSERAVGKHIQRLCDEGRIRQISKKPAHYVKADPPLSEPKPVGPSEPLSEPPGQSHGRPRMNPAKLGGLFALVGADRVNQHLKFDQWGKAHDEGPTHLVQFGRYAAQFWAKGGFWGQTPEEIISNARAMLLSKAREYEKKWGVSLTLVRWYRDIEWVEIDGEMSARTAEAIGAQWRQKILVGDVWHKLGDSSHPWWMQFNVGPAGKDEHPTSDATTHRYLYLQAQDEIKEARAGLAETMHVIGAQAAASNDVIAAMKAISDSIIVLNQKVITMEEEAKSHS